MATSSSQTDTGNHARTNLADQTKYFWDGERWLICHMPPGTSDISELAVFAVRPGEQGELYTHLRNIGLGKDATTAPILVPRGCKTIKVYSVTGSKLVLTMEIALSGDFSNTSPGESEIYPSAQAARSYAPAKRKQQRILRDADKRRWVLVSDPSKGEWAVEYDLTEADLERLPEGDQSDVIVFEQIFEKGVIDTASEASSIAVRLTEPAGVKRPITSVAIESIGYRSTPPLVRKIPRVDSKTEPGHTPRLRVSAKSLEKDEFAKVVSALRVFHISAQCLRIRALSGTAADLKVPLVFGRTMEPPLQGEPRSRIRTSKPEQRRALSGVHEKGGLEIAGGYVVRLDFASLPWTETGINIRARKLGDSALELEFPEVVLGDEIGVYVSKPFPHIQGISRSEVRVWRVGHTLEPIPDGKAMRARLTLLFRATDNSAFELHSAKENKTSAEDLTEQQQKTKDAGDANQGAVPEASARTEIDRFVQRKMSSPAKVASEAVAALDVDPALIDLLELSAEDGRNTADAVNGWWCLAERAVGFLNLQAVTWNENWSPGQQVAYLRVVKLANKDTSFEAELKDMGFLLSPSDVPNDALRNILKELRGEDWKNLKHLRGSGAYENYRQKRKAEESVSLIDIGSVYKGFEEIRKKDRDVMEKLLGRQSISSRGSDEADSSAFRDLGAEVLRRVENDGNSGIELCRTLKSNKKLIGNLGWNALRTLNENLKDAKAVDPLVIDQDQAIEKLAQSMGMQSAGVNKVAWFRHDIAQSARELLSAFRPQVESFLKAHSVSADVRVKILASSDLEVLLSTALYRQIDEHLGSVDKAIERELRRGLNKWPLDGVKTWKKFLDSTPAIDVDELFRAKVKDTRSNAHDVDGVPADAAPSVSA